MKTQKHIIGILLSLILCLTCLSPAAMAAPKYSSWFATDYMELTSLELVPERFLSIDLTQSISRKEMCELAVVALEKITENVIEPARRDYFSDTDDIYVVKAHELGVVNGDGNGKFRPNDNLTRQEFFVIINNFCNASAFSPNNAGASLAAFPDTNSVSH